MSLELRLAILRRRRRQNALKQFAVGPLLVGISIVLLAAFGSMASLR
jgi:hypothetical protein